MQKALFLDRDGVINYDLGYVHTIETFHFIDGIFELVKAAHVNNFITIVITNQAGIGRGYYTEAEFVKLTNWMTNVFVSFGAPIHKVYFSPYHPIYGLGHYLQDHFSRKPHPGMILSAQREFNIDLQSSILIGDSFTDIQAAHSAGIGTKLLLSSHHSDDLSNINYVLLSSLKAALHYILPNTSLDNIS